MGRLTKEMKKAELMEQLTEANEAYLEKISQHMECQYREMQRVEQRIERKKKLIDKKYSVSIKKLKKERKEKLKKIVGRYRRIKEKVREATIDKVDLAEIENIEKGYITLRQFLLNILRERETGKLPNWKERITERSVESEISTDGGAVVSKLRALQYEFTSKFNIVMGQMPDSDVPAYSYLSRGGYIYLTERNCEFFKLFMGNDEDCEYIEYDIIGCIKSKKVEELDERVKDQIKEGISCQIKAISEWKLDLMAAKVFEHLTFDKGKTVKEVYKILSRCMAEEKTVRISRKAMLEKSIAKQRERLDKYIDLCADGIITKQELMERRKGLDNQIADLQSQYESVEQEDECSEALDMNLISQKLDEWQRASKNDVNRELINSCVAQITPLTNEEFRWALDFQMSEVRARNAAAYTMDGFVEMARFSISFEEAKAFKASRNQGIRKNEWQDLTVVVGIWSKTQK